MRPSRSHTQSWSVPGMEVRPTELVNNRFGNAATADQFPEIDGAISGIAPFRKPPTGGRESKPWGPAFAENKKPARKTATTSHGLHLNKILTDKFPRFSFHRNSSNFMFAVTDLFSRMSLSPVLAFFRINPGGKRCQSRPASPRSGQRQVLMRGEAWKMRPPLK